MAQGTASREILKLAVEEATDLIVISRDSPARVRAGGRHTGQDVAREARCSGPVRARRSAAAGARARAHGVGEDAPAGATA